MKPHPWRLAACVGGLAWFSLPVHAGDTVAAAVQSRPLADAQMAPALLAAAEHDGVALAARDAIASSARVGDAVVFWVAGTEGPRVRQWLIELKRARASPAELGAHRPKDVTKYLSWGSVVVFHSDMAALDLWVAGPVDVHRDGSALAGAAAIAPTRRTRVYVPQDLLRLGLDESIRVAAYMRERTAAIRRQDPSFTAAHIYARSRPIAPAKIAEARPVGERLALTPEMERSWIGGYVALEAFYRVADEVPELHELVAIATARPSVWKLARAAFGTTFRVDFGGALSHRVDPAQAGLLPVGLATFQAPFTYGFGRDAIVSGAMAVTAPTPPLDVCAGIIAIVAAHPKDPTRVVQLVAISATRGAADVAAKR